MNGPSDTAEVRRTNLALVLGVLDDLAPCSRTDLRHATGLVSGSVSSLVDELAARGLVTETGVTTSNGRGRPRRVLDLIPARAAAIAIQLTGTEVIGDIRDLRGDVLWQRRRSHTIGHGVGEDIVAALAEMADAAERAAADLPLTWVSATVIAVPGPVVSGRTLAASIPFGVTRTELAGPLQQRMHSNHELVIRNDGRLGALAEYAAIDPDKQPTAMAYVTGGPGVTGGLVIDGDPYLGSHLMAGEVGHISVAMDGPLCGCGARGCLTLYLGNDGLLDAAGLAGHADKHGQQAALDELLAALGRGEGRAQHAIDRAGTALAAAVGTMSNYTDLDLVVLGGTLPRFEPWLLPHVQRLLTARRERIEEFNPRVVNAIHGEDATRIGAWMLARQLVLRDPAQVPLLHHA